MLSAKTLSSSSDLFIQRCNHGVKLLKPRSSKFSNNERRSLHSIMQLPLNVYLMNPESEILAISERSVLTCGFVSQKDALGRTIRDVAKWETAEKIISSNCQFLKKPTFQIVKEPYSRLDNYQFEALSFKFPWYSEEDKIMGIFGFSILPGSETALSLADSLSFLIKLNLLSHPYHPPSHDIGSNSNQFNFTKRENDLIRLLVRGQTAREIAKKLSLSVRTVEHYMENLKNKVGVNKKSELIDKLLS